MKDFDAGGSDGFVTSSVEFGYQVQRLEMRARQNVVDCYDYNEAKSWSVKTTWGSVQSSLRRNELEVQ